MVRAGTLLLRRYVSDKWLSTLYREQWALAYRHGTGDRLLMGPFHQLIPPLDRFWADPFPIQVGNDHYIFHEELLFSTWQGSSVLPLMDVTRRTALPAGRIFEIHGEFYRPAQDCSTRYGSAVVINRILQLNPETYEEIEMGKVGPDWVPQVEGVHTFNVAGNITVIDCLLRRRKFLDRLARQTTAPRPPTARVVGYCADAT